MATKSKVTKTTKSTSTVEVKESTSPAEKVEKKEQYRIKKDFDPNMIVTVKNGFHGHLVYKSKHTQEKFVWNGFGDEQDMDLKELKNAKNSSKAFFENNWFLIDDPEILEYLGVSKYYEYALNFDSFDKLFTKTPSEIADTISKLSAGQRKSVVYRAKQLIDDGVIDSIKVINTLEEALSTELIER